MKQRMITLLGELVTVADLLPSLGNHAQRNSMSSDQKNEIKYIRKEGAISFEINSLVF